MQVGFVGLGVMGFPMAGHLAAAGHEVRVYNRSPNKAETWATRYPGTSAATLEHLAEGCQLIGLCVGRDSDVRDIVPALLSHMAKGGVIVDHTTTSAHLARDMAEIAAQAGIHFLDAPVSGGQAGAESGQLTIMVGGSETGFAKAEPVIQAYAKAIRRMGPSGAGQQAKMANQICIAGVVQGLAEAVHFCRQSGLDADLVLQAISQGAAQSWQMNNRWSTMVDGQFDFGFAVDLMRKDLGLVLDEARSNGARLPVTAVVDQFYAQVQAMGGGRWDTSSLVALLNKD